MTPFELNARVLALFKNNASVGFMKEKTETYLGIYYLSEDHSLYITEVIKCLHFLLTYLTFARCFYLP